MEDLAILKDLTIISLVSVLTVALLQKLKIPTIAGFIMAGVIIGPSALGLISDSADIGAVAEFGVILLLFGIGLELSLDRIKRLMVPILIGGGLQVVITILITIGLALWQGYSWQTSIFLGFIFAVSSTAILIRALQDRGETDTPHGRLTVGILLFQDICVVPFLLMIPVLAGGGIEGTTESILTTLGISAAIIAGVVISAIFLVPKIFEWIAATKQKELFMLTVFLVCIVTAWLISLAGIKLALGAFFAGVIVAGSAFRHQAMAEIMPFRIIFTSIFFVSVGMLLNLNELIANIVLVLILLALILVGKFIIIFLVSMAMRLPIQYSIQTAVSLSQVGEFSFVLMQTASGTGLVPEPLGSSLTAAAIISMLITPILIVAGPKLATGAMRLGIVSRFLGVPICREASSAKIEDHVIIIGYGFTGQKVAEVLRILKMDFLIVDLNPENVRTGMENEDPIYLGDATNEEILAMLGADSAREIIISINDEMAVQNTIRTIRHVRSDIHILVRTKYLAEKDSALQAGANEVVIGEEESANRVLEIICQRHGVSKQKQDAALEQAVV